MSDTPHVVGKLTGSTLVGLLAGAMLLCGGAIAAPAPSRDASANSGVTIAQGSTRAGVVWRISALRHGDAAEFDFHYRGCGYCEFGFGTPYPPAHQFHFNADTGEDLEGEREIAGVTRRAVSVLRVRFRRGGHLTIRPHLAPPSVRAAHHWLDRFRVFDRFFYRGGQPSRMVALDKSGHKLGSSKSHKGLFMG